MSYAMDENYLSKVLGSLEDGNIHAVSVILVMLNDNPSVERKLEGYR